jgi:subtilase family serine protease
VVTQTTTRRASPDVAYNANPNTGVYVRFNNSWYVVGGTSAGTPQWAALLAIADQGRAVVGSPSLGTQDTLNALYSLYNTPDYNDITAGTSTGHPNYSAGLGYDLVTGMGTPNANFLITDLVNWVGGGGGAAPGPQSLPTLSGANGVACLRSQLRKTRTPQLAPGPRPQRSPWFWAATVAPALADPNATGTWHRARGAR